MRDREKIRVKFCGLRRPEDVRLVNECRPDYAGFIINVPKSFRSVTTEQLRELVQALDPRICPVGVFVNAGVELPAELLREGVIRMAQLHGQESSREIQEIQRRSQRAVCKAFSIKSKEDIFEALQSPADYILLDQGAGGTGKVFDWTLVPEINRPWFLAGGLNPENLETAVTMLHPWGVDLSSGLETDRKKDRDKMIQAMSLMRQIGD